MKTLETNWIKKTVELTFQHNRDSVDVLLWDADGCKITIIKNQDADIFLSMFNYGECYCDDMEIIKNYLSTIL